jgi:selenocysteine-specific elongation factor
MTAPVHAHVILGTAGHIDHGKSSLVRRLTGIDPDRLPEEQARGMTIDLGFAHLDLAGRRISLVDVPGHERFVRNMVAGATGVDAALLVVAADDGVMPQTREHIDILSLLGIDRGLVVITKADLAGPDRVAAVEAGIRAALAGTGLADAPAVAVSNLTGEGFDRLAAALGELLAGIVRRRRDDVFRLPVDRSFTVPGRGTVVTGSLLSGRVAPGEEVELLPAGRRVRVRGVQSHHEDVGSAVAGMRAAVNLAGIKHDEIARGYELATIGLLTPSPVMEVSLRLLASAGRPLRSRAKVRVTLATREEMATVLLPAAELAPGAAGFAQLRFASPVVAEWGQPFIVRDETAARTLGGGRVLRPVGLRRWKGTADEIATLRMLETGNPAERLRQVFRDAGQEPPTDLQAAARAGVLRSEVDPLVRSLAKTGELVAPSGPGSRLIVAAEVLADAERTVLGFVGHFHKEHPARLGIARRELLAALEPRVRKPVLEAAVNRLLAGKRLAGKDDALHEAGRAPPLSEAEQRLRDGLEAEILAGGFTPPDPLQAKAAAGADPKRVKAMTDLLVAQGRLAFVAPGIYLHVDSVARLKQLVADAAAKQGPLAVKDIRDLTASSRRYVVPICEFLDKIGFTQRVGDARVVRPGAAVTPSAVTSPRS